VLRRLILPIAVLVIFTPFFLWWLLRQPSPIATIQVSSHYGLAFSPDGRVLAIKDGDEILLWNSQTRALDRLLDQGRSAGTLAFSPDGKLLASVDYIGRISIRDVTTWQLRKPADGKKGTINLYQPPASDADPTNTFVKAAFSPDSKQLATCHWHRLSSGTDAGEIRIWDVASGALLTTKENQEGTLEVTYSPDGTLLASGNDGGEIRLWDTKTWHLRGSFRKKGLPTPVLMAFTPDGKNVANGGGWSSRICLYDIESRNHKQEPQYPKGIDGCMGSIAFSQDEKTIAVGFLTATLLGHPSMEVGLYDWRTGQYLGALPASSDSIYEMVFSKEGLLAVKQEIRGGAVVKIWDVNDFIKK
jgi:WD40 repeat protein